MRIIHKRKKCIGCGSCVAVCPAFWEIGEDGKAHLLGSQFSPEKDEESLEVEKIGCNQEAADVCPVQCICIEK